MMSLRGVLQRAGVVLVGVLAIVVSGCSTTPEQTSRVVAVSATQATVIQIDNRWTVSIPAGAAGPNDEQLTITELDPSDFVPAEGRALAAADLRLSSGQPRMPLTFSYRLDEPLAGDQTLYLLDDDGNGNDFKSSPDADEPISSTRPQPVRLSEDRRVGTVEVSHLSLKSWFTDPVGSLTNAIGQFLGQRTDAPSCQGNRPKWLTDVKFVTDQNAPMLVCVGADPANSDIAVVKIANNRGSGLVVTSPLDPTWSYQTIIGPELADWAPNLV